MPGKNFVALWALAWYVLWFCRQRGVADDWCRVYCLISYSTFAFLIAVVPIAFLSSFVFPVVMTSGKCASILTRSPLTILPPSRRHRIPNRALKHLLPHIIHVPIPRILERGNHGIRQRSIPQAAHLPSDSGGLAGGGGTCAGVCRVYIGEKVVEKGRGIGTSLIVGALLEV
jgi:hypothetical protein